MIGVDIGQDKLELARQLGAAAVINAAEIGDPADAVLEVTGGGADLSVDALGLQATCRKLLEAKPDTALVYISCEDFQNLFFSAVQAGQQVGIFDSCKMFFHFLS